MQTKTENDPGRDYQPTGVVIGPDADLFLGSRCFLNAHHFSIAVEPAGRAHGVWQVLFIAMIARDQHYRC